MKLADKVAIVTGSGQGIGRAIALAFAREGANVVIFDKIPQTANEAANEIISLGRQALVIVGDVSNGRDVNKLVEAALETFGRINVLVNAAGIAVRSPIIELSEENWDKVIDVNLKGTFLCCQAVGKVMIKQKGGSIINIASIAGHTPQILLGAYSPSKAGVISLTELLAIEWAEYGVRVNAISPGPIKTPLTDAIYADPKLREARCKAIPMKRFGEPEEVANVAVFLASEDSSYITGHTIVVDGGSLWSMFLLSGARQG